MEYTKMVSTKLEKIDKNEVAKKCLVRKNWSKTWTIVEYEGFTITARLITIDTKDGMGTIELLGSFVPKKGDIRVGGETSSYQVTSFDFPLFRKDFTQKAFNERLVTTADTMMSAQFADNTIKQSARYIRANKLDQEDRAGAIGRAEGYCQTHNITEPNVQCAIKDKFINEDSRTYAIGVEIEFDPYIFADVLYALSCWLGLKDKQEVYKERMNFDWKTALDDTTSKKEDEDDNDDEEATDSNPEVAPVVG